MENQLFSSNEMVAVAVTIAAVAMMRSQKKVKLMQMMMIQKSVNHVWIQKKYLK